MKKALTIIVVVAFILGLMAPFALADEQVAGRLPYQEFIDKGWLYKEAWDRDGEYDVIPDKLMEVAYSPLLKVSDRLIEVQGSPENCISSPQDLFYHVVRFGPILLRGQEEIR